MTHPHLIPSPHHPIISSSPPPLSLSIIILSYNRKDALLRTIGELERVLAGAGAPRSLVQELILVDNASADGSLEAVRERFAGLIAAGSLRVLALSENLAIEGFNRGAAIARGDTLLILDDDAWPDPASLAAALDLLERDRSLAGVALLPIHPRTSIPEWRFPQHARDFPAFGCANLVRASAWRAVGGYQREFFLYRNDVDLALKFLGAGLDVAHNPDWFAWHDSPLAARKSLRWLHLATRNWVWLTRRHSRPSLLGWKFFATILLQFAWTLREAGLDTDRLTAACDGLRDGLTTAPPPVSQSPPAPPPAGVSRSDGLWRLVTMLIAGKRTR
jgi:GT2 family glycosyltransferase